MSFIKVNTVSVMGDGIGYIRASHIAAVSDRNDPNWPEVSAEIILSGDTQSVLVVKERPEEVMNLINEVI